MTKSQMHTAACLGASALLAGGAACQTFVALPSGVPPRADASSPAAVGSSVAAPAAADLGQSLGTGGLALVAAAAGCAAASSSSRLTRRAAAVKAKKKKGVRVVEGKELPWNLFAPKAPYKASCISNDVITTRSPLPNWETVHTVIRHDGNVPYVEGQSIGVVAPGPDKKGETPAKLRLYSIASSSPGDDETGKTVSLCVKRVLEVEGMGWFKHQNVEDDPEFPGKKVYRGVCSSHIADLKTGDDVLLTGPVGAEMLLPEDPDSNVVMLATGTGIAPFRSFLRRLFHDKGTKGQFQGLAWLFLGVPWSASLLYDDEWKAMQAEYPGQFRFDYAISNEEKSEKNKINGEMWVQHKAMKYAEDLWALLKNGKTHVYMCGLRGMESGLQECLEVLAERDGLTWADFVKTMKKEKRYHVEVY